MFVADGDGDNDDSDDNGDDGDDDGDVSFEANRAGSGRSRSESTGWWDDDGGAADWNSPREKWKRNGKREKKMEKDENK